MNVLINKFLLFGFIGWFLEIICISRTKHKLSNNHFLYTPICPMYGLGGLFISLAISNINNYLLVFLVAGLIAITVEYSVSYFMEKLFHTRWWDYSYKKYHINGRISLTTSIDFGILGICIKIMDKFLSYNFNYSYLILSIVIIDLIISTIITYRITNKKKYHNNILSKYIEFKLSNLP